MTPVTKRRLIFWTPFALLLIAGLAWLFRPQPVPVDLLTVERGPMRVTVDEDGETRIRDVFVVSAPIGGVKRRITHRVGDEVTANDTVITSIVPTDPAFLDPRSERQAEATVKAAEAALEFARADVRRAEAEFAYARSELERARRLARSGNISESALDRAEREMRTRQAALEEAQAQLGIREFELERARAALVPPSAAREQREGCDCVNVYSPVDGRILRILAESESVVPAGAELVEVGDPGNLEVVVDLLSSDAVQVEPGQEVIIEDWGGERPITGVVRRIEPYGFTRVSALGIEEQRVNVIVDIVAPREQWQSLGHGYRVEARIVLWESPEVLKVPLSALFRQGDEWAVFKVENGTVGTRIVEIGRDDGIEAEVLSGLNEGDRIVRHPSGRVRDGSTVVQRTTR
ncbi:MAG TPA: HlyD family efflux transporter periplasmic adaptor subunit [Arenicellales bacterium]|nr:HlyD family efflux transporter periplasmic adaptor subunit [Arenicellales bacterium]